MSILVTGGSGMIGTALKEKIPNAIFVSSADYDLTCKRATMAMFEEHKPSQVIHLAAKVGGVHANKKYIADFYTENIQINTNVLLCAKENNVEKLVSLLSTCIYPRFAEYPLTEEQIHNGIPDYSNYGYAFAKRMLDVQSRSYREQYGCNFITAVPNNLYGENDYFDLENSHVIPAIIRKIYEAKIKNDNNVKFWGRGAALREFTYSKDLAGILIFLLEKYNGQAPINIGGTREYSIKQVVNLIAEILEYEGYIGWDIDKPTGQYRKPSSNNNLISLGWGEQNYTSLREGLTKTCEWFKISYPNIRGF